MKLNIGSSCTRGIYKQREWINLDPVVSRGVNIKGDGCSLPFRDNSIETIHAVHVLEHLTRDKSPIMIEECCRVLEPGGECYFEVPNFQATIYNLASAYNSNDLEMIHIWRTSIYGKTEREGMAHHFGFDIHTLRELMKHAGFNHITRLYENKDMISPHYKYEPVLLMKGIK